MKWTVLDDSGARWTTGERDEGRHLLVLHDGELREYHEVPDGAVTVHVYDVMRRTSDFDSQPLAHAVHLRTHEVSANFAPWVRALDDRELIEWLMAASYASAA